MVRLFHKLWNDELGAATAEFGLVTATTVGALIMSMGNFAAVVNHEFETAVQNPGLMSIEEQREEKEKQQKQDDEREIQRIRRFRRAAD